MTCPPAILGSHRYLSDALLACIREPNGRNCKVEREDVMQVLTQHRVTAQHCITVAWALSDVVTELARRHNDHRSLYTFALYDLVRMVRKAAVDLPASYPAEGGAK